jgi:hypothetical protein
MNISPVLVKTIGGAIAPLIIEIIQKGVPKEKVYEEVFDACTKFGVAVSDQLNASLGGSVGEGIETMLQGYIDTAFDAAKAGLNNGFDMNELPNDDADV